MLHRKLGTVTKVLSERPGAQEILVGDDQAINYPDLTGKVEVGDQVLLNTTAVDLDLGTGGVHFVIANLTRPAGKIDPEGFRDGHIMKLRYTPLQEAVLSVEEDDSPDQQAIQEFVSLENMPVVCCELHSQIAPVAAALKAGTDYKVRIAYIMTDGAALPIGFSRLVAELKEKGLLDATITCGQAFGGDIEAINVYTGLIAAKQVAKADAAIVCQGPGNAGTGSKFGFSGIQQGEALNAVSVLGGTAIAVLRVSFADPRERHRGLSHHTMTILTDMVHSPVLVALPDDRFVDQLSNLPHQLKVVDGEPGLAELTHKGVNVTTMGRSIEQDREFFLAASAGGVLAAEILKGG
ncbi:MAG TPA: DUF3866 family protein [Armatimonadota bacterium]|nr:DUF3866 family protein [Armatimonadota bacterium]